MTREARTKAGRLAAVVLAGASLAACATVEPRYAGRSVGGPAPRSTGQASPRGYKTGEPYQVGGIWYVPKDEPGYDKTGVASWYGDAFNMKATADGEIFDMNAFSAAHTTLPLPSMVEVTNLDNGRKLAVRVNDRGPFVGNRIIDLSHAAAAELGYDRKGLAHVRVRYLGPAPLAGPAAAVRVASTKPAPPVTAVPTAAATVATAPITIAALPPPPSPVAVTVLPPLAASTRSPPAEAGSVFRIQAGAFGDQNNARLAADRLSEAGVAVIEPMERGGVTLYRVMLPGPADEAGAFALRDRVAGIGFADARVVRTTTTF